MSMKMLVTAKLGHHVMMNQHLQQAITLLQYNALELRQLIQHHMEMNPFLSAEEEEKADLQDELNDLYASHFTEETNYTAEYTKTYSNNYNENTLENYSQPQSLRAFLLEQTLLCGFDLHQTIIAEAIIDAIDKKGYLEMQPYEILNALSEYHRTQLSEVEYVLQRIKTFEPAGVASANLKECLLTQLKELSCQDDIWQIAVKIVSDHFETSEVIHKKDMIKKLKISQQQYIEALSLIRTLNPYPGLGFNADENTNIEPELIAKKINHTWRTFLIDDMLHIKINEQYKKIFKDHKNNRSHDQWKQKLDEAQWLLSGLRRRNETLLSVASHIIQFQHEFLEKGQHYMKSMSMVDVAKALDLHESTISRVTTGKYIATPRGNFELKYFFSSHVSNQVGEHCSAIAIKSFIKDIISSETAAHIYSDSEIADLLHQKGINIARRTIAKYREAMHILSSYQRQQERLFTEEAHA